MDARVSAELSGQGLFFDHFHSPVADSRRTYPAALAAILNLPETIDARKVIESLSWYVPTPLRSLPGLATALGIAQLSIKDESTRFGLRAFKGVGGVYAIYRLLRSSAESMGLGEISVSDLVQGKHRELAAGMTVACATTGNHGRSVARAAQIFGCRCVIYVPVGTTAGRITALEALGAQVVQHEGNYDGAVERAGREAASHGWFVISDTAYPGQADTPRNVMHGYRVIVDEVVRQWGAAPAPTHIFIQTGVGGIAAAFCSHLWEVWGTARPRFVVVESRHADCMLQSARAGKPVLIEGELKTRLYGLASGKPSTLAWEILAAGADDFVSIDDAASLLAMRVLASPQLGDPPVIAGEAGAAGLGALMVALASPGGSAALGLDGASRVLLVATEGATDPATYADIVGESMEAVLLRQQEPSPC
jgi:diaminopropionate ammonia-lyase